jgi:copper(I)-binding protein
MHGVNANSIPAALPAIIPQGDVMDKSMSLARRYLAAALLLWSAVGHADGTLTVGGAWVSEAPPHAEVNAAYLTLHNPDAHAHILENVSSPQFQSAEIHATHVTNGQVRMQRMNSVVIAAHGDLEFKPGEYHLMLIQPLHPPKLGDTIVLKLTFKDVSAITVRAPVRDRADDDKPRLHPDMTDMQM